MELISLDTETTGIDLFHGAKPFLVTVGLAGGLTKFWQWPVDPVTREPDVPVEEIDQVQAVIDSADEVALHNAKYDVRALSRVGIHLPWSKVRCTLMAAHLLASNHRKDLTACTWEYLRADIEPLEIAVREVTRAARKLVRSGRLSHDWDPEMAWFSWRLATEGDVDMPSVKATSQRDDDKPWKNDMWLPRAVCAYLLGEPIAEPDDPRWSEQVAELATLGIPATWLTATSDYANGDSAATRPLWLWMAAEIDRRQLRKIYDERLRLLPVASSIEGRGITISRAMTRQLLGEYSVAVDEATAECLAVADQFDFQLELPAGAAPNDSIREFIWGSVRLECPLCGTEVLHKEWAVGPINGDLDCPKCLKRKKKPARVQRVVKSNPCLALPKRYNAKSGSPSLDKDVMEHYEATLEPGPALDFVKALRGMRSRQTACTYMRGYEKFWLPAWTGVMPPDRKEILEQWFRLHASLNPCGTDHLRWASYNPNAQNISKKEDFNLRRCFGPMPSREWWSMDGKNLELRIPAYEAGEAELMWVFDHPDEAPYYGSYHLVVFDLLHPQLFALHGKGVKELFESTWYQWVKNMNFAIIYGCQEKKADETAHMPGAYKLVAHRFPKIAQLSRRQLAAATRYGYVETIPDRSVDPDRGYPILASRTEDGRISPTTPMNYHVSGTAMQWTNRGSVRCYDRLEGWQAEGWDGYITMQVHDELVFDCPLGAGDKPWETNLPRMRVLQKLLEQGGNDIGVPTPVSVEWHSECWATGIAL